MIPRSIRQRLGRLRRRERLLELLWGGARWLALVLTALVAACAADWLIDRDRDTPWFVRGLLLGVQIAIAAAAGLVLILWPLRNRLGDDKLALWVEEKRPAFGHRLITAVQLNRPAAAKEGMSEELIQFVTVEAEKLSERERFEQVADHSRLSRALMVLTPALLLIAAPMLLWPNLAMVLLSRQLLADVDIPRVIHIAPLRAEEVRPAGEKVTVKFHVRSELPIDPKLLGEVMVTSQGQAGDRYPLNFEMAEGSGAVFSTEVAASSVDFSYRARLGDGRTKDSAKVRMVPRPVIVEQNGWVQLPEFCGLRPDGQRYEQPQARGDIVGILGSNVRVAIKTQHPVRRAFLRIFGPKAGSQAISEGEPGPEVFKREVVLSLDAVGTRADGTFELRADETSYLVIAVDEHGFDNVPPPRRLIRVAPEEPPQVVLLREQMPPEGPLSAGQSWQPFELDGLPVVPGKKIRVGYAAHGPYGLGHAKFLYRIIKKAESGNDEVKEEPWRILLLPETPANPKAGKFDPKRGAFEGTKNHESVYFHPVPSPEPDKVLGRTLGGGRFDFETKGIVDQDGQTLALKPGDTIEFCIEVHAPDRKPNNDNRPWGRSEVRVRPIVSGEEFGRWFAEALQEERRLKDLELKQRGVLSPF